MFGDCVPSSDARYPNCVQHSQKSQIYIYINKYLTQPKRNPVIGSSHVAQGEEEET